MKSRLLPAGILALSLAAVVAPRATAAPTAVDGADAITGRWETEDGKAHVEITRRGGEYVGEIVWLGEPLYPPDDPEGMGGRPRIDRENPDPGLRHRPIVGLQILEGLEYDGDGEWTGGTIYDPEIGKTYKCKARLSDDGRTLHLRGYIGFSLLGRTSEWRRVAAPYHQSRPQSRL